MRVQYTLKEATVQAIRQRAESLGIQPSRLVEEYLTTALRSNAAVTLTPQAPVKQPSVTPRGGSKPTTSQTPPPDEARRAADEALLAEIFEPARPVKPLGEMTDDELDALDERDTARGALASS